MYGQTSFDASKNSKISKNSLTACLVGLIVCYQVISHIFLHQAISHEEEELDGCAASGYSSLCMEAQLFAGWHETADSAELDDMLAISPPKPATSTSAAPAEEENRVLDEVPAKPAPATGLRGEAAAASNAEVKPEALESLLWDLAWSMGGGAKDHDAPEKHRKKNAFMAKETPTPAPKKKSFTVGLTDLQDKLEAKMKSQARKHAEHRALRALSVAARGHTHEGNASTHDGKRKMTAWAQNLDDITHELQAQMDEWHKERDGHAAAFAASKKAPAKYDPLTPFAHNLEDMQHSMEDRFEHRKQERAEHAAQHERDHAARLKALHAGAEPEIKTPFMSEVEALGRQLCQDPARHDRPACQQFLKDEAGAEAPHKNAHETAHDNAMAHIKLLEKHLTDLEKDREHDNEEIRLESTSFLKELCADPSRHDYPACKRFLAAPGDTATTAKPASRGMRGAQKAAAPATPAATKPVSKQAEHGFHPHVLHWRPLNESHKSEHTHMGAAQLVMNRQELRGAHWEGKIPKVACVTVLPKGEATETLMKYFMDNYNLQHYDGERELVLVFHSADKEASRVAHLYADGKSIKAVAARGEADFPSATAYRYGAWVAHDADLIARWDFEAWHHPNRLSMQVRAIATSDRPASLVASVTGFDADGKKSIVNGGIGPHGSMLGDAAWMRKHWMPLLEEENALVHGLHSGDVVQIEMPELLAYHDVTMLGVANHIV